MGGTSADNPGDSIALPGRVAGEGAGGEEAEEEEESEAKGETGVGRASGRGLRTGTSRPHGSLVSAPRGDQAKAGALGGILASSSNSWACAPDASSSSSVEVRKRLGGDPDARRNDEENWEGNSNPLSQWWKGKGKTAGDTATDAMPLRRMMWEKLGPLRNDRKRGESPVPTNSRL